jgi:P4 family phage/plasmid primase-like protien
LSGEETNNRLPEAAEYYAGTKGWYILPCHGIVGGRCTCAQSHAEPKMVGKHPVINQWNLQSTNDPERVKKWWDENSYYNIGVHCQKSGFFVIDIDPRSGGEEAYEEFLRTVEIELPPTVEAVTGVYTPDAGRGEAARGRHLYYACDPSEALVGNLSKLDLKGVDIKHNGYVMLNPSNHFSGIQYDWLPGHAPWEMEIAEAPEELLSILRKSARKYTLGKGSWEFDSSYEKMDIDAELSTPIYEGERAVSVYRKACALFNKYGTEDMDVQFVETSMIRYNAEMINPPMELEGPGGLLMHVRRAAEFVKNNPPQPADLDPALKEWAERKSVKKDTTPQPLLGVVSPRELDGISSSEINEIDEEYQSISQATSLSKLDLVLDSDSVSEQDGGDKENRSLTDTGNGRRLVDYHQAGIRYTSGLGWFTFENGYWRPDTEGLAVKELAKKLPSLVNSQLRADMDAKEQGMILNWSKQSRSDAKQNTAIASAKSDPRILTPVDVWDRDENLLGVLNGVVDLRTGNLMRGDPNLYITKRTSVAYTPGHKNMRWEKFLNDVTKGDKELQAWLQMAAGYSLTNSNIYDIFFLVYGPPGSGKNTFVEAVVKCLGTKQYAWPLDSQVLSQSGGTNNSSDQYYWAQLRGRRLVWVDELPESERIKENAIKRLTGSSEITGRSPGEDPFVFESRAKLWISTNHRPIITDDAMWRRIRPIPFNYTPDRPDPELKAFLFDPEGGLPAVLAWAVEGAVRFYQSKEIDALGMCTAVREAAEIYQKNEDRIGAFLAEETEAAPGNQLLVSKLYHIYKNWSESRGERPLTQIAFQRKLSDRGTEIVGTGNRAVMMDFRDVPPQPMAMGDLVEKYGATTYTSNIDF